MNEPFSLFLFCLITKGLFTKELPNSGADTKPKGLAFITKISLWRSGLDKPHRYLISNLYKDQCVLGPVLSHALSHLSRVNVTNPQLVG